MNAETRTERNRTGASTSRLVAWQGGVVGGLLGGLVFGLLLSLSSPGVIHTAIPALYGIGAESGVAGWVIHLSHAAVLGVVFAALADATLEEGFETNLKSGLLGLAYGLGVWAVLAVIVMPIWLDAVGFAGAPDVPNVDLASAVGHAAYGAVLGVTYGVLSGELSPQ
ncbi:histidine kinase [Halorubrum sp. AD140]|uniref:histidine kinase n=1 Tax=Halorubrum sp. AD140 TaxID=3050073 RepID=UPI002ACCD030|nr:histidine kinase [Halorubrum sp. AD140]MDZ5810221.1 histidine kinase [Halorubrum sp. AD140]